MPKKKMILRHNSTFCRNFAVKFAAFYILLTITCIAETTEKRLKISELSLPGQQIGFAIEPQPANLDRANFYVVYPVAESSVEKLITVNERTGEIRLQSPLDHEKEKELIILVIPTDGSPSQKVVIEIEDSNDNTPTFPVSSVQLEISEQAHIDTELPLPLANDPDSQPFNVQKYRIAGGNVNNVFRLSARRLNNQLYADLIVNGNLDREYRNRYDLLVEAIDGGSPPKIGKLEVLCIILDANDNRPEFEHSRYSIQVPSNATLGQSLITVSAKDSDDGENARITYTLLHANYEEVYYYQIDSTTGQISVAITPLPAGTTHELLITATDNGMQPLESSVFLTINILDEDFGQNTEGLQISWLTENSQSILVENLTIGYLVARLEIAPEYSNNMKFTLTGCDSLCLKETDSSLVFLLMVCGPLDRESHSYYRLLFTLSDSNSNQVFQHPVHVDIEDLNDNQPEWSQPLYKITFNRSYDDEIGQRTVGKLVAHDRDVGENAHLRYSLHGTNLFQINSETGVLTAIQLLNCSVGSEVKFRVVAEDNGRPRLSSSADVIIELVDADAQPPFFEKSLYEVVVKEDIEVGECLVQVKASNRGCGIREDSQIQYSLQVAEHDDEEHLNRLFRLDTKNGKLCLGGRVDFERRSRYQLTVLADGQQGKTSSALIDINIEDLNDHAPQFQPHEYHLKLRENQKYTNSLLKLYASDEDRGDFGKLHYFIEETSNDVAKFRLDQDSITGQLYLDRPLFGLKNQSINEIQLKVNARDGGGMTSPVPATIHIYIQSEREEPCIIFSQTPYEFSTTEDILPGIIVGTLRTQPQSPNRKLEILAGDPNRQFRLDSKSGRILITKELDADHQNLYWLTVKTTLKTGSSECSNYTQVKISIRDLNDNDPKFDMSSVEANILEDYPIHEPFFAVQAIDKDRNENGRVTYELVSSDPPCPVIVRPLSGQLLLAAPLDYEKVKKYKLRIRAQDQGIPPRSSTINLTLNVFDVNDFSPEFSNTLYTSEISEDASLMSEVLRVSAVDQDEGANSRIRYQFSEETSLTDFGINPTTGEIFVRKPLDRERQADYRFLVVATDQGTPPLSSNASIIIQIGDINDNSPNCSSILALKLNEQQNNHRQLVGVLNAKDMDAGPNGTVMYRLQKYHEIFDLKPNGELFLRRKIQNLKDSYRFSVIAEDQGPQPRSAVCQVLVRVEGSPSEIIIQEPIERTIHFDSKCEEGCPIVRLNATNVKRWSLEQSQKTSKFFDLTNDGLLRLSKRINGTEGLDQMFRKPEALTINLFDAYEQKKQITLNMKKVVRLMDNSSMVVHLSDRSMPGTRVTFPARQKDSNESIVYYSLNDDSDTFEVDTANGALYLRQRLNYSQNSMFTFKLTKFSLQRIGLNETTLVVDIQNENMNPPRFETPIYKFSVSEGTSVGTVLAQIEAFDEDEGLNGTLNYQIIGENPIFGVEPSTGEITLKQQLQYHLQPKHYFVLEATDQAPNTNERRRSSCVVVAEVFDTNDNSPIFLSPSSMNLLADLLPTSHPIHYFVATDADSEDFGRVSYKIVNGNHPQIFLIDQKTGALTVLHRPTNNLIQLTVRASDSDPVMPRFTEQLFTIYIQQNEAKWTYFQQPVYDFTLASATINNTLLVDFKRPSFEISAKPKFKLLPQTITDFELDSTSGVLKTNTDLLKYGTYRMTVHVSDVDQKLSDLATVLVHVPEHKTFGPKIATESCREVLVKENEPIGRLTRVIATINNQESPELQYQIEGGSGVEMFSINSTTGVISAKPLDRETISEHILVVSASDNSVPRKVDVCTIRIKVLDQNDNSPQFNETLDRLEITSDHQVGVVVAKFEAIDKDEKENGKVIYKLSSDENGIFDVNTESGELFFARELPFLGNTWEITLLAEDSGLTRVLHTEKRIQVHWKRPPLKMDNFRELEFLRQKQTILIAEGQPRGKFVLQLETTAKFMADAKVIYEILEGNSKEAFTVDELGVLKTGQELDAETQQIYHLKLQASISGNRRAIGYVIVRVLNINDNAPSFPHALSRRIEEDTPVGSLITSVMARDLDIESTVEYALTAPNEYFELQRSTGDLFLLKSLDYETMPEHLLSIQ